MAPVMRYTWMHNQWRRLSFKPFGMILMSVTLWRWRLCKTWKKYQVQYLLWYGFLNITHIFAPKTLQKVTIIKRLVRTTNYCRRTDMFVFFLAPIYKLEIITIFVTVPSYIPYSYESNYVSIFFLFFFFFLNIQLIM